MTIKTKPTGRPPKNIEHLSPEMVQNLNNAEWLHHQHHVLNKTLREIADETNTGRWFITSRFRKYNVPIKHHKHINIENSAKLNDLEWLKEQHHNEKRSIMNIAKELGIKATPLLLKFKKAGIPIIRRTEQELKTRQQTCVERYGVSSIKLAHIKKENIEKLNDPLWLKEQHHTNKKSMAIIAKELGVHSSVVGDRLREFNIETKHYGTSLDEQDVCNFIKSFYDGEIRTNDRVQIHPKEIDIYIPEYNIGIEYHGLYWHTTQYHPQKTFHSAKVDACLNKDIMLYQINENEWTIDRTRLIWKSMIKNAFGLHDKVVYGRKCVVVDVPLNERKAFLEANHLQGNVGCNVALGLRCDDELVALMTFSKPRFNKKYQWEIARFAVKLNYKVPGAASKLFKFFITQYAPTSVLSYADRRYSKGKMYQTLGFEHKGKSEPNYGYLMSDGLSIDARYKWQKHKMKAKLKMFDENLSEEDNMRVNGFYRIYDSGHLVYVWETN